MPAPARSGASTLSLLPSLLLAASAFAAPPTYGPELQGFDYPHPLQHRAFNSQGVALQMAYMDVAPTGPANGRTAVLLHGKNFCGATWESQIAALAAAGFRVVVPDQVGFCASTKPERYQYSFQQLAANTHALLRQLDVGRATLVAHSTGGMLAVRYALMYPAEVAQLALVNPIGLEDWKALGVPAIGVDDWFRRELGSARRACAPTSRRPTTSATGSRRGSAGSTCSPG